MTNQMEKALLEILRRERISNEAGEQIVDFTNQGLDRLDFGSVSRATLRSLMEAAYTAGQRRLMAAK